MKNYQYATIISSLVSTLALADSPYTNSDNNKTLPTPPSSQGWSIDLGGQYTWMSFKTPPTYSGNTGGVTGKITYQKEKSFFGQLRSTYNNGKLSSHMNSARDSEWYSEFVGGYCFPICPKWTITPYAGTGFDFLIDHQKAYSSISSIQLEYKLYYAIVGFDTRYTLGKWSLGAQLDCLPTFNQYLSIEGLSGVAWKLQRRVGAAVRLPVGYKITKDIGIELAPYYRLLPIGASDVLGLPHRNLSQWGSFLTFRFFL